MQKVRSSRVKLFPSTEKAVSRWLLPDNHIYNAFVLCGTHFLNTSILRSNLINNKTTWSTEVNLTWTLYCIYNSIAFSNLTVHWTGCKRDLHLRYRVRMERVEKEWYDSLTWWSICWFLARKDLDLSYLLITICSSPSVDTNHAAGMIMHATYFHGCIRI